MDCRVKADLLSLFNLLSLKLVATNIHERLDCANNYVCEIPAMKLEILSRSGRSIATLDVNPDVS